MINSMIVKQLPRVVILLFVAMISAPMVKSVIEVDRTTSLEEKRKLAQWPSFDESKSLKAYFSSLTEYTNDQFGYRDNLISLNKFLKFWIGQSPSKNVIRGQDDWLFLKINDPLASQNLEVRKQARHNIEARAAYIKQMHTRLSAQGIGYLFLAVPNKATVYSEYLPNIYSLAKASETLDYFKATTLDASDYVIHSDTTLLKKKHSHTETGLYFKNDTHWNFLGSSYAYIELNNRVKRLWPNIPLVQKPHDISRYTHGGGDLAQFIGLNNKLGSLEPSVSFPKCTDRINHIKVYPDTNLFKCDSNQTKVLIIGDSFMGYLYQYLSESAGWVYTVDQSTSRARLNTIIDELEPHLVIEQLVERSLARGLP